MNIRTLLCLAFVLPVATGCATSAPQVCNTPVVSNPGYVNALKGNLTYRPETVSTCDITDTATASADLDADPARECNFKKGLFNGEHGQFPAELCAASYWDEYHAGYVMGRKIFEASSRLEVISEALENSRSRLWKLEADANAIGRAAEIARIKSSIDALLQVRDVESRRLQNLQADNL